MVKKAEEFIEPPQLTPITSKLDTAVRLLLEKISQESGVPIHELAQETIVIREGQVSIVNGGTPG